MGGQGTSTTCRKTLPTISIACVGRTNVTDEETTDGRTCDDYSEHVDAEKKCLRGSGKLFYRREGELNLHAEVPLLRRKQMDMISPTKYSSGKNLDSHSLRLERCEG